MFGARQIEHTALKASCGHDIRARLEMDPVVAADMIATFMGRDCGRRDCLAAQERRAGEFHIPRMWGGQGSQRGAW